MGKEKIRLKLRFYLLESAMVMEVVEMDREFFRKKNYAQDNCKITFSSETTLYFDSSDAYLTCFDVYSTSFQRYAIWERKDERLAILVEPIPFSTYFENYKKSLTAFAKNLNVGEEPPIPRLERVKGDASVFNIYTKTTGRYFIKEDLDAISEIMGKEIPIYEPKPHKFESSWALCAPSDNTLFPAIWEFCIWEK
jgi:hypothetical protein